jgi:hypothetical protein
MQLTVSALGNPPNNGTPWYKNACVQDALKTGAINARIDAIGFIPEAGGIARIVFRRARASTPPQELRPAGKEQVLRFAQMTNPNSA